MFNLYFVMVALLPVLSFMDQNKHQLYLPSLVILVFATIIPFLAAVAVFKFIFKSWEKSTFYTSISYLIFMSYADMYKALASIDFVRHRYLALLYLVLFIALFVIVKLLRKISFNLKKFIWIFACLLSAILVFNLVSYEKRRLAIKPLDADSDNIRFQNSEKPNVYYLIFDGFAGIETLKNYYNYDLGPFVKALEEKGFYVPQTSFANYSVTFLSMASSLNMAYVDEVAKDARHCAKLIEDSIVKNIFVNNGYEYINLGWSGGKELSAFGVKDLAQNFFTKSMLNLVEPHINIARTKNEFSFTFKKLMQNNLYANEKGKFVYTHFLLPHWPYVYNSDGDDVEFGLTVQEDNKLLKGELYLNQLIYIQKKILELITKIHKSDPSSVIIIQSDHGWGIDNLVLDETVEEWERNTLNNFMAIYLAEDSHNSAIKQLNSPINLFRYIFNEIFGLEFDYLQQKAYSVNVEDYSDVEDKTYLFEKGKK